jgi:hypothetical protein
MNKILKHAVRYLVGVVIVFSLYVVILMIGHAIPKNLIWNNVVESYSEIEKEGIYPEIVEGASWDNWTAAILLNSTVTEYGGNLLEQALANAYTVGLDESGKGVAILDCFKAVISNDENIVLNSYSRYWVGELTLYKILLIFTSLKGIRGLLLITVIILLSITVINIYKAGGGKGIIPFLAAILASAYIPISMCLIFGMDIIIMLVMINVCCYEERKGASLELYSVLFMMVASLDAYLNYWAFPLITLGFPLVFLTTLRLPKVGIRKVVKENFILSIFWAVGLAGTVLAKQALCYIVLGTQSGIDQIAFRMGEGLTFGGRLWSTERVIENAVIAQPIIFVLIVSLLGAIIWICFNKFEKKYSVLPFLIIAVYPIIWMVILAGHNTHGYVAYMLGVTYYAVFSLLFLNFKSFDIICILKELKNELTNVKMCVQNILILCVTIIVALLLKNVILHCETDKIEPWSSEVVESVDLSDSTVDQQIMFDSINGKVYLKNISTVFINLPSQEYSGKLRVELSENGTILKTVEVSLDKAVAGDWFKIPIGCTVYLGNTYNLSYSLVDADNFEPYLFIQDDWQKASSVEQLYINGVATDGGIMMQFEYDRIVSNKIKLYIVLAIAMILVIIKWKLNHLKED